ncbi:MAG TPA: efflux RND transporter periplasmic adaptor subunit [Burkholderiaceae bacterium]|jgi:Cu(I)/Ag(I) efflux system membrane fusion protein
MNAKYLPVLLGVTLVAAGVGIYQFGLHQGMKTAAPVAAASAPGAAPEKRPLYWRDPMYPTQKFDKPGKSPFMDMQLQPVYGDGEADQGNVNISPRMQQNLGIRTAEAKKGMLDTTLAAVGSVAYNERDVELVQARSNGFVEHLYVRASLDPVKKGQPLAEVYVPDWIAAQEEYLSARRMQGKGMDALVDGARQRMRLAGMSDEQIRQVESSGKVHARITVTAPAGGVVAELSAREGMTVLAGAPLFRINGLSTVWVYAEVPENAASQVRPGMSVSARTPALPGNVFTGKVAAILPEVSASTRTLKARIELANPRGELVPGMFVTLNLSSTAGTEVLLVPSEAVIQTGTRSVVMLAQGDGKFLPTEVETGREWNGQTEIRKGLEVGQKVVVSGQFLVDSEATLSGATERMADATEPIAASAQSNSLAMNGMIHHGQGRVERIAKDVITISHGRIASLDWAPMTMDFKLLTTGLPRNIAVGDMVGFDIRQVKDGTFAIVAISLSADVPKAEAAPDTKPASNTGAAK